MNAEKGMENRYNDDEIDLFELIESLWQQKWLIVICTLVALAIGGGYAYTTTPTYSLSAQIGATTDLKTSIRLTGLWNDTYNGEKNFTTPVLAQLAANETPYSPTSLFLRFGELISSGEMKQRFVDAHPDLAGANLAQRLSVSFPKRLESSLGVSMSLTTNDREQLAQAADATNTYLKWARQSFSKMVEAELNEAVNQPAIKITDPASLVSITAEARAPGAPIKPKKALILALSVVLGGMLGVFAALIRGAIRKRKAAQTA